jgi:hypothetical protein
MGEECVRLAQEGKFQWRERHTWGVGKATVNHRLQLGYPRIGNDLATVLVIGDQLAQYPDVSINGEEFANWVDVLGSGQGRKMRHVQVGKDDGRLRRLATVHAKRVRRPKRLKRIGNDARSRRHLIREVEEVCIYDDGTLGSINLGDTLYVASTSTWDVSTATQHRVITRRYRPDDDDYIYLGLERAERSADDDD